MKDALPPINILFVKLGTEPGLEEIPLFLKTINPRIRTFGILNSPNQDHCFDEVVTSTYEAMLGAHPEYLQYSLYVKPELFERITKKEGQILRMYDRVAIHDLHSVKAPSAPIPQFDNSTDARSQLFLRQAAFWDYAIERYSLHAVVAQNYGHNGWDAVLQAVAEARNLPYLFFHEVRPFFGSLYIHERVSDLGDTDLGRLLLKVCRDNNELIPDTPDRVKHMHNQILGAPLFSNSTERIRQSEMMRVLRQVTDLFDRRITPRRSWAKLRRSYKRRKSNRLSMQDEQNSWSDDSVSENYIFCELQSQPNATTAVKVWTVPDQRESLAMVAKNLPRGWSLVVKESDRQWSRKYPRRKRFWSHIAQIPNVHIVPYFSSAQIFALGARAVLESSYSSIALYAIQNRIPLLVLGETHIGTLPNVYRIHGESDLVSALSSIQLGDRQVNKVDECHQQLKSFADLVRESTLEGALSSQPPIESRIQREDYFKRMSSNIARVIHAWLSERSIV